MLELSTVGWVFLGNVVENRVSRTRPLTLASCKESSPMPSRGGLWVRSEQAFQNPIAQFYPEWGIHQQRG